MSNSEVKGPQDGDWEGPKHSSFCLRWVDGSVSPVHPDVDQFGSSTELWYPEFVLGFHYVGMVAYIIGHVIELHLQPSVLPQRLGWPKVPSF